MTTLATASRLETIRAVYGAGVARELVPLELEHGEAPGPSMGPEDGMAFRLKVVGEGRVWKCDRGQDHGGATSCPNLSSALWPISSAGLHLGRQLQQQAHGVHPLHQRPNGRVPPSQARAARQFFSCDPDPHASRHPVPTSSPTVRRVLEALYASVLPGTGKAARG